MAQRILDHKIYMPLSQQEATNQLRGLLFFFLQMVNVSAPMTWSDFCDDLRNLVLASYGEKALVWLI